MTTKDIAPQPLDERPHPSRGKFRHATNRQVQLALKGEVQELTRKSLVEVNVNKELKELEPPSSAERTIQHLAPQFVPDRYRAKRKLHPIFHEDLKKKEARDKSPADASNVGVPPYNALDREKSLCKLENEGAKSNRYPHRKEQKVSIPVMQKPHVSSVGVVPSRSSEDVKGLRVLLEGQSAVRTDQDPVLGPVERANTAEPGDVADCCDGSPHTSRMGSPLTPAYKPAIVASRGTIGAVPVAERAKPATKPRSRLKPPKSARAGSAGSVASSLKSVEIHIPSGKDGKIDDARSSESNNSLRSVKDLLEEAKQMVSPEDQAILKKKAARDREALSRGKNTLPPKVSLEKKSVKSGKSGWSDGGEQVVRKSAERSVDEIIASLKDQSNGVGVTESDRKIQEIMQRVLSRTTAGAEVKEEESATEPTASPRPVSASPLSQSETNSLLSPVTPLIVMHSPSDEDVSPERTTTRGTMEGMLDDDITVTETTEPVSLTASEENVDMPPAILEALEKLEERTEAAGSVGECESVLTLTGSLPCINVEQYETDEQCYEDLHAPSTVCYEDIISVQAKPSLIHVRDDAPPSTEAPEGDSRPSSIAFLSSWQPLEGAETPRPTLRKAENSVHHFCTMTGDVQLPDHLRGTWRRYHVPSKYNSSEAPVPEEDFAAPTRQSRAISSRPSVEVPATSPFSQYSDLDRIQSAAAKRIMEDAYPEDIFEEWKSRAEEMFGAIDELSITGQKIEPQSEHSNLFWKPAPPKWDVPPAKVKQTLFPHYDGAALLAESEGTQMGMDESSDEEEEEVLEEEGMDPDDIMAIDRTLNRRHNSAHDLTRLLRTHWQHEQDIKSGKAPAAPETASETLWTLTSAEGSMTGVSAAPSSRTFSSKPVRATEGTADLDSISEAGGSELSSLIPQMPVISFADMRARFSQAVIMADDDPSEPSLPSTVDDMPVIFSRQRRHSAPGELNRDPDEDSILVYEDFTSAMEEISKQRQLMKDIRDGKVAPPNQHEEEDPEVPEEATPMQELPESPGKPNIFTMQQKKDEPTPAELALEAGRAYVLLPQKRKKKRRHQLDRDVARIEAIQNFLNQEPGSLKRSLSDPNIDIQPEGPFRVPVRIREKRTSVTKLNLDELVQFIDKKGFKKSTDYPDKREFVRKIWDKWFDHTFPPTPASSDWEEDEEEEEEVVEVEEDKEDRKTSAASTVFAEAIDMDPIIEDEQDLENNELMQSEVDRLSELIEASNPPSAFHIARRGALYRKLGKIKSAKDDLDLAIKLEPMLIDAYWHRHLLFLLQNKKNESLSDLNTILKHNNKHAGAYRSRATIYRQSGDITMAIVNFTQAIKLDRDDYEAYYQRAEMYEKRGELLLAMEDYAVATKLMPSKTEALFKHGMHYFNNGNWQNSINDFTELIKQDPINAQAHMFRGRAFAKLKQWNHAVEGLSASIHLDPNNKMAFYYRGCILRKLHPKRALQDFSVSLMIDDSEENLLSYLHRGILYDEISRHEDAIPDFEACLKLDKDMAVAHVNLGLIFMLKMDNYHRAIKKFTQAIKSDPTYVKAYVCRAEAYTKIHEIKNALLDFTRAIHLRPDVHHFYMYRGQLVLRMGNLDLAAFCVKHAAEMNAGLGSSATQQAIVQSFLKNFDKAISALEGATRVRPVAPLFVLLGKTHMKARMWKQAVASFEKALEIVKPWQTNLPWPPEAAEMYFLIGMCQVEQRDFLNAHDGFNNSIRVDQKYADAYYWRGMTKMRLKQSKGIQDFNRALSINPKLFQAYLSRAAFYGMRGQNTKAILNCNEAIKLQPQSVRAYLYRGALKYHIRAYKLAIMDLTTASQIDSTCALAYFSRAVCHQDSDHHQKAFQDYGIVLLLGNALKLKVLINRGLLYFDRKDYRNALHDFQLAVEISPFDKRIHHTLGLCHHKLSQLREAVESFSKALKSDPFFLDAYLGRGNVFMDYSTEVGLKMARRDYERALRLDPCCLSARVNLGYNLQVCGRYQLAWNQFTAAINIQPDFQPALEGRAIINLQMSDTFAAFQDISASVAVQPTAELLTNRGVIHQFMGDRNLAMRDYQHALKLDTTYALAYFNAANVYFHMRQFKQAQAYYHQALQYDGKDESALLNRAITKVMLRDAKGALADFEKAIKLSPHSAHMYFNRANLYCTMKEYEKAELDYCKALELQPDDALVLKRRADVRGKLSMKAEAVKDYRKAIEIQTMRHK